MLYIPCRQIGHTRQIFWVPEKFAFARSYLIHTHSAHVYVYAYYMQAYRLMCFITWQFGRMYTYIHTTYKRTDAYVSSFITWQFRHMYTYIHTTYKRTDTHVSSHGNSNICIHTRIHTYCLQTHALRADLYVSHMYHGSFWALAKLEHATEQELIDALSARAMQLQTYLNGMCMQISVRTLRVIFFSNVRVSVYYACVFRSWRVLMAETNNIHTYIHICIYIYIYIYMQLHARVNAQTHMLICL